MILSTDYIITLYNHSVLFNNIVNKFDVTFWITVSYYHLTLFIALSHIYIDTGYPRLCTSTLMGITKRTH